MNCEVKDFPLFIYFRNMINKNIIQILILTVCSLYISCGIKTEELETIVFEKVSSEDEVYAYESKELYLKKNDQISLWSKLDIEYEDNPNFRYKIQIFSEKEGSIALFELNPLETDQSIMCYEQTLENISEYNCTGRIDKFYMEDSGNYIFKAAFFSDSDKLINLKEASLLIKKDN